MLFLRIIKQIQIFYIKEDHMVDKYMYALNLLSSKNKYIFLFLLFIILTSSPS